MATFVYVVTLVDIVYSTIVVMVDRVSIVERGCVPVVAQSRMARFRVVVRAYDFVRDEKCLARGDLVKGRRTSPRPGKVIDGIGASSIANGIDGI